MTLIEFMYVDLVTNLQVNDPRDARVMITLAPDPF
jgi:hypothetical protein